jgi:hypothetical protein
MVSEFWVETSWDVLPRRFGVFLKPFVLEGFFRGESAIRVVREQLAEEIVAARRAYA